MDYLWEKEMTAIDGNDRYTGVGIKIKACREKQAVNERYLADSNCCTRFCRPLPNHSAKVPIGGLRMQR